ncbi:outer membrane protein assembly factor BamB family protein [Streptomyces avermitilis]
MQRFRPAKGGVRALEALGTRSQQRPWPKHSLWGSYLNGSKLISWELLHELLQLTCNRRIPPAALRRADHLWKAAKAEQEQEASTSSLQQIELDYQRRLSASLETELALQAFIHAQSRAIDGLTVLTMLLLEKRGQTERDRDRTREELDQAQAAQRTQLAQIISELEEAVEGIDERLERTQKRRQRATEHRVVAAELRIEAVRQVARIRAALESVSASVQPPSTAFMDTITSGADLALVVKDSLSMDAVDSVLDTVELQQQADRELLEEARQLVSESPDDVHDPTDLVLGSVVVRDEPNALAPSEQPDHLPGPATQAEGSDGALPLFPAASSEESAFTAADPDIESPPPSGGRRKVTGLAPPAGHTAAASTEAEQEVKTVPPAKARGIPPGRSISRRRLLMLGGLVGGGAAAATGLALSDKLGIGSRDDNGKPTPSASTQSKPKAPYAWKVAVPGDFDASGTAWAHTDDSGVALITQVEDASGKKGKNYVYVFDERGSQRWRTELASGGACRIAGTFGGYYCTGGGRLYSLGGTGKVNWSRKLPSTDIYRGNYLTVGEDRSVYTTASYGGMDFTSGELLAYQADGTLKWTAELGAVDSQPLVKDTTLYVGSYDDRLYAISAVDGGTQWSTSLPGDVAGPAMIDNVLAVSASSSTDLYGLTELGKRSWTAKGRGTGQYGRTVPFGNLFMTSNSTLTATRTDGTEAWTFTRPSPQADAAPWLSTPAVNGKTLFCCSDNSYIFAISTAGKLLWSIDTKEAYNSLSSYAPLITDSFIYVASDGHILAFNRPDTP